MNKGLILMGVVAFLVFLLLFSLITIAYYDENQEKAPCNYWKLAEYFGYGANDSISWNKRIECGLIEDASVEVNE